MKIFPNKIMSLKRVLAYHLEHSELKTICPGESRYTRCVSTIRSALYKGRDISHCFIY